MRLPPLLPSVLLITGSLVIPAAGPAGCPLPQETSAEPVAVSCGLELVGALEVSADGGLGQLDAHGDLLAVVQRDDGQVALVDVADPTALSVLGRYDGGTGQDTLDHPLDGDVAFSDDGTLLFHARQTRQASNEGLHVLDVRDPSAPTLVAFQPQGGMLRVAYAELAGTEVVATLDAIGGLTVSRVDRTPAGVAVTPVFVDALPALKVGGPASGGLVIDPHDPILGVPLLYASDGTTGLTVYDLRDPARPSVLGRWSDDGLAGIAVDATADGRIVYAAREYWFEDAAPPELVVLDASEPGAITEVSRHNLGGYDGELAWKLGGLALDGDRLHVAHGHVGLLTVPAGSPDGQLLASTTDLGEPNPTTAYRKLAWYAMDVASHGGLLWVTDAVTGELRAFRP